MDSLVDALAQELVILRASYDAALASAKNRIEEAALRAPSTHLGHNLGATAHELSVIAAKIEQTTTVLRDVKARIALGTKEVARG